MLKFKRRDYQADARASSHDALVSGYKSILLTGATGTGKTVIFADLCNDFVTMHDWRVLILAPRRELINQAYIKIRDACDLKEEYDEIEKEMGKYHFNTRAKVVVGSIQTCSKDDRLQGWTPDAIIIDEAHFCMSESYRKLFARFPDAALIGFTATAMRGDRQPLFHEHIDGSIYQMEERGGKIRDSRPDECAFEKHVWDYPLENAVSDGWLVEPRGFVVPTGIDISGVKSRVNADGERDFSQSELNAVLESTPDVIRHRINCAISAWKQLAHDRPTVVFCHSVEYSKIAAEMWVSAGFTAKSIDAKTEESERDGHLMEVHRGNTQVTTNYGIYTHGTDVDKWSCVVIMRPTESQGLLSQIIGRVTRPLQTIAHKLNNFGSADQRRLCIASSGKPDSIVIDMVDIVGKHKLATLPTVLGLPANLNLQGRKLTEAAKLVREFDKEKEQALFECPATFEELEIKLREIRLLTQTGAKHRDQWMVAPDGSYTFGKSAPGYSAKLTRDGARWNLKVSYRGEVLLDSQARSRGSAKEYFDAAAELVTDIIKDDKKKRVGPSRGTIAWIEGWKGDSGKWALRDLRGANFTDEAIDALPKKNVFAIIQGIRDDRKRKPRSHSELDAQMDEHLVSPY